MLALKQFFGVLITLLDHGIFKDKFVSLHLVKQNTYLVLTTLKKMIEAGYNRINLPKSLPTLCESCYC